MSEYLKVAGTVYVVAEYNGKLSVIDWKTAKKPKVRSHCYQYFMQAAAYAVMFEEVTEQPVSQLVILGASEEGEAWQFIEKRDDWIGEFQKLREQYRMENNV
jgi:genome maintenance exonuclease 1